MPAVSKEQRRLAGMTLASKHGRPSMAGSGMMSMSMEDLKDYASVPEKGMSMKKSKRSKKKGKSSKQKKKK